MVKAPFRVVKRFRGKQAGGRYLYWLHNPKGYALARLWLVRAGYFALVGMWRECDRYGNFRTHGFCLGPHPPARWRSGREREGQRNE